MHLRRWFVCVVVLLVYSATPSIAATETITTFSVAPVEPSKTVHPEVRSLSSKDIQRWTSKDQVLLLENFQLAHPLADGIDHRVANAFVGTVYKAYSDHYPLELSVEDIWVAIAQGVSIHLNENAEKYRHYFVSHDGKKELNLMVDTLRIHDDEKPSGVNTSVPAINWPAAVRLMTDLIKADMKADDLVTLISQPFSQTTTVQHAVFDACLMDSVKAYYDYRFSLRCGIPQVTLRGSPADFQSVIDRLNQLKLMFTDLHWWLDPLLSHMQKFKESAEGKPDIDWWQKVCHSVGGGSDISMLAGWLADFVPYVDNRTGHYRKARQDHNFHGEMMNGIDFADFNEAVTQTNFILDDNGHEIPMKLIAGFIGIGQNPITSALRPVLGWLTTLLSVKPPTTRAWDKM